MERSLERVTVLRFNRRLGKPGDGGDWDVDSAVSHSINRNTGRTTCGRKIGLDIKLGGKWEYSAYPEVTCRRCMDGRLRHL